MSKFNTVKKINNLSKGQVETSEKGLAYKMGLKSEITLLTLSTLLTDTSYQSKDITLSGLQTKINKFLKEDPANSLYLAKLAWVARHIYGLRSVTHVIAGEIAGNVKGQTWTKNFFEAIIRRPDDMLEIMSYYSTFYGKLYTSKKGHERFNGIAKSMQKGFKKAFNKFGAYELAKYKGENKECKLIDLVNIIHPKPNESNAEALKALVAGTLKNTETWEAKISDTETDKEKAWKSLVLDKKLGYIALIRNLRNIIKILTNSKEEKDFVLELCKQIKNPEAIKKSLVFPYMIYLASVQIQEISNVFVKDITKALNVALDLSCNNVPSIDGKTLLVYDSSGSMYGDEATDNVTKVGIFVGALLKKNPEASVLTFSTSAKYVPLDSNDTLKTLTNTMVKAGYQGGTNFDSIFVALEDTYFDNIIVFTDEQGWDRGGLKEMLDNYRKKVNPNLKFISYQMDCPGFSMFPEESVAFLSGLSDKSLDLIPILTKGTSELISYIEREVISFPVVQKHV